jgi:hypothetical protein
MLIDKVPKSLKSKVHSRMREIIIDEETMVLHNKNSNEFPKLVVCTCLKFLPKCANINKDHVILFTNFKSSTWKKTWTPSFMLIILKRKFIKIKRVCIATINKNLNITHFHILFGRMETLNFDPNQGENMNRGTIWTITLVIFLNYIQM